MAAKTFTFRLTAEGVEKLEADLKRLGPAGEEAFKRIRETGPLVADAFDKASEAAKRAKEELERTARSQAFGEIKTGLRGIQDAILASTAPLGAFGVALRGLTGPLGTMIGLAGGLTAGASAFALSAARAVGELGDLAEQVGITVAQYQQLSFAAGQTGLAQAKLEKGLQGLSKTIADARAGGHEAIGTFREIGVYINEAGGKARPTIDVFEDVAEAISRMEDPAKRLKALSDLGLGPRFASTLANGAAGIRAMREEAGRLGTVISEELVRDANAFSSRWDAEMKAVYQSVQVWILERAMPALQEFKDRWKEIRAERDTPSDPLPDLRRQLGEAESRLQSARALGYPAAQLGRQEEAVASIRARIAALEEEKRVREQLASAAVAEYQQLEKSAKLSNPESKKELADQERRLAEAAEDRASAAKKAAEALAALEEKEAKRRETLAGTIIELERSIGAMQAEADALFTSEAAVAAFARSQVVANAELKTFRDAMKDAPQDFEGYLDALKEASRLSEEAGEAAGRVFDGRKASDARREANRELERQAEEAARLWSKPFENAIEGIQGGFADAFTSIFDGGVNSFKDLAGTVKGVFTRLAGEIAALMVFRPVVGGVLGAAGLGGLASQMGLGGGFGGSASAGTLGGQLSGAGGGGGMGGLLGRVPGFSPNGFGGISFDPTMSWAGNIFGGNASSFAVAGVEGAASQAALGGAGLPLGDLLGIGGGLLSIGLPLLQGNFAQAGLSAIGGGIGALFGPAGFGIGAGLGSLLGGLFGFGKKKIPKATAYYGPEDGNYSFLSAGSSGSNAPTVVTQQSGDYTSDLLNSFIGASGLGIDDPTLGFYLRGKGNGRAFGGLFNPVSGQIEKEWANDPNGNFEGVAQATALYLLKEASAREAVTGDPRTAGALRRSLENNQSGGQFHGDHAETLQRVLSDVEFAADFDAMIQSFNQGVSDFTQSIGVQAREEVKATTEAVAAFKEKTEALGLPMAEAEAATRSLVEILFGMKEAEEPLSLTARAWESLIAKFENAGPLFEEVGLAVESIPAALAAAQAQLREDYDAGIADQIRGFTDPLGLAMEQLAEQQEQQLADATLIGGNIVELERLHLLQREALLEQATGGALDGIRDYLRQLEQGPLSTLTPLAKLEAAGFAYTSTLNAARAGDAEALAGLTGLATPYLQAAQSYYGGNAQYAAIFDTVTSGLGGLTTGFGSMGAGIAEAVAGSGQATVNGLTNLFDESRKQTVLFGDIKRELADLRGEIVRLTAISLRAA